MTFLGFVTSPSVNKNTCRGYYFLLGVLNRLSKGSNISVPPISALNYYILLMADSTVFSSYLALSLYNLVKLLPKLYTLKNEFVGNDLRNSINASFAFSILVPLIEPLLSNTNIKSLYT